MPRATSSPLDKPAEAGLLVLPDGAHVPYVVKRSTKRRRSYGFVVDGEGRVVFSAPKWVSLRELEAFAVRRRRFIGNRLSELAQKRAVADEKALRVADLEGKWCELTPDWYRKAAKRLLTAQVQNWAGIVGVSVRQVKITSGRTVWGSCTSAGDINLSWRLLLVPAPLREYVVVHELCHRVHMNHGVRFWRLVERYIPDYLDKRQALNRMGGEVG